MEEAAILAAIAQFPEEDTPRLAYADWLDDHADALPEPDAARIRAEFIRLQCELKRYEDVSRVEQNRYIELYRRQDAILTRHRRDLLGPLGESLSDIEISRDVVFDRGFVTELRLDSGRFIEQAETIAMLKPLPEVAVTHGGPFIQFGEWRHTEVISTLRLRTAEVEVDETSLFRHRQAEIWPRLHTLNLGGCGIRDFDLRSVVESEVYPALTRLDLTGNEISDEGVRHLVNSPLWPRLSQLVLDANPISDVGAALLANAATAAPRLEYLNLKRTGITSEGHRILFRRFPRGTKLDLF